MSDRRAVRIRPAVFAALIAAAGLTAGCGGQPKAQVSGTVTLDGVPIESGAIQFYPTGGKGQSAGGGIENGKYAVDASVGEMTVTINGTKVVGKQKMYDTPDSPVIDKVAETVPAKYNSLSELKVTLTAGPNEKSFELVSEKRKR